MVTRRNASKYVNVTAKIVTKGGGMVFRLVSVKNAPDLQVFYENVKPEEYKTVSVGHYLNGDELSRLWDGNTFVEYSVVLVREF